VASFVEVIGEIERRIIQDALKKHHWNKQKTAQALGLSRQGWQRN
jgi:transcriptional regulator with PAS, ATPase and Fis domain